MYIFNVSYTRWHYWKCGYTQLEAATTNKLHVKLQPLYIFGCSGIYKFEVLKAEVWLGYRLTNWASWTIVHFLGSAASRSNPQSWRSNPTPVDRLNSLLLQFFNTIFVSSHMYPENPEETQVIVGSMNMGYISDTARNRTHNLFVPSQAGADTTMPQWRSKINEYYIYDMVKNTTGRGVFLFPICSSTLLFAPTSCHRWWTAGTTCSTSTNRTSNSLDDHAAAASRKQWRIRTVNSFKSN